MRKQVTEVLSPTVYLKSPEKKGDPKRWKKNIRKKKSSTDENFDDKNKKGKAKEKLEIVKQWKIKEGCDASCTIKFSENFDLNARVELFNAYWSLLVKGNLLVKKKKHTNLGFQHQVVD